MADRVFSQSALNGADILDERCILFHPAPDHSVKLIVILANDGTHGRAVERQHHVITVFIQSLGEAERRPFRQQVAVEGHASRRTRHRTVRAEQPQVEPERLRNGHCEIMPAAGTQNDFHPILMSAPERIAVFL